MTLRNCNKSALIATVAMILPTTALAELTAEEVWSSWRSYAESMGQTVSVGSETNNNGTLVLNDLTMSIDFPEGKGTSSFGVLEFKERGDGTVAITMAPDLPMAFSIDPKEGEAVDLAMIVRQTGLSIIASGEPGNMTFDYLASDFSFDVDTLVVDGKEMDVTARFALAEIDGQLQMDQRSGVTYSSNMKASSMNYDVEFTDPEEGGRVDMSGTVSGVRAESSATIPEGFDPEDPAQMFANGFSAIGSFSAGPSNGEGKFTDASDEFSIKTEAASSALNFSLDAGSMEYGGSTTGVVYNVQSPQIPFPEVNVNFAELAFRLLMPLNKSDEPSDFAFLTSIKGMEISDMIWGMFDPSEVLPRDPATVIVDVKGQMNWMFNITDPEEAEAFEDDVPAELHNLAISEVVVSALGAEVNAAGSFTFDNTDLETFDGLPAPTGKIDANIIGVNGLMDKLTQMGFLPQDQAMGARMMLGLFARPAGGEDSLTSTIEVNGDGSIFANGQQLQ